MKTKNMIALLPNHTPNTRNATLPPPLHAGFKNQIKKAKDDDQLWLLTTKNDKNEIMIKTMFAPPPNHPC